MYLKMSDFILGMGKEFALEAMEISEKVDCDTGQILFKLDAPADHFFVLIKGRVKLYLGEKGPLYLGEKGPVVYHARHPGEIIGWSTLIGREAYSASAECTEAANLLRFEREGFLTILRQNPANEARLYKRLAEMLGNRLLELYPAIP